MKKLYTTILIIAVTLFISCNEQKAEDDIKKAFTKITDKAVDVVDAVDKVTPKPTNAGAKAQGGNTPTNTEGEADSNPQGSGAPTNTESEDAEDDTPPPPAPTLTKPVLSSERAPWGTVITFPKAARHTYALKEQKTGVTLSEGMSNTMQVTATQSAQNVIIVATFDGTPSESNPIEFTRIPGNTLSFAGNVDGKALGSSGTATHTQTATSDGTVAGDDREIVYSVSGIGATIDSSSGEVTLTRESSRAIIRVTAELQQNEKYTRSAARYVITVASLNPIPPALSSERAPWGTVITFPVEPHHVYRVYEDIDNIVTLRIDGTTGRVTATQSIEVEGLSIEAKLGRNTIYTDFSFTRKQGNTLSFADATMNASPGDSLIQTASKSGAVAGDTRNIKYSVNPTGEGVTIDSSSGEITISPTATERSYIITAELQQNKKYEGSTAIYRLSVE